MRRLNILIAEKEFNEKAKKILSRIGKVIDFSSQKKFWENLPTADVVVTGLEVKFSKAILDRAENLKVIGSRTTQLRYIDLEECRRRGIRMVNIKANSIPLRKTPSTAEEAAALLFALIRKIPWAFDSVKNEKWERRKYGGNELFGKTIGLIGFGRLGRIVAGYSRAFGMRVIACDPYVNSKEMAKFKVQKVNMENLLKKSDAISLHVIYNNSTYNMLKRKHFRMMKPTAIFINTARGEITDEKALLEALQKRWIAGAAVDTLAGEMSDGSHLRNNPLVKYAKGHENLIIVPHLGGATKEATERTQIYISKLIVKEIRRL